MKGIVDKRIWADETGRVYSHGGYGFIKGEDGNRYFFHSFDIENCNPKKLLTYNIVRFEPYTDNTGELKAKNVTKIGYGKKHPYIKNLAFMKETVNSIAIPKTTKRFFIKDIEKMIKYLSTVEDYEQFNSLCVVDFIE
jgi:cold shock CspA family protein